VTTSTPTPSSQTISDDQLYEYAQRFAHALLDSADSNKLGKDYWERAKSALETGAAASTSWAQCVSISAKKLQIDVYKDEPSRIVTELAAALNDPETFARLRDLVQRNATYIIAIVRAERTARRKTNTNNTNNVESKQQVNIPQQEGIF